MTKPTRIDPIEGVEINPPSGGRWMRDADGGLTPADRETAIRAGLAWPGDPEDDGAVAMVVVDQVPADQQPASGDTAAETQE